MPIIKVISGDLLDAECKIIAHQCNCVSTRSYGLSSQIAKRFPWANIYSKKYSDVPRVPGTIKVLKNDEITIICMFAQWSVSKPTSYYKKYSDKLGHSCPDSSEDRINYFKECLKHIDELCLEQVAIPYMIGCGLAGGNWKEYEVALNECKSNIIIYSLK